MPTPHHSVFYRPDALPAAQPTASKALKALNWFYTPFDIKYVISETFCPENLLAGYR